MRRQTKEQEAAARNTDGALQLGFFEPESDWKPTPLSELPDWKGAKRIGIDAETRDLSLSAGLGPGQLRGDYTVGWAFAIEGGPKHYIPLRHEAGGNVDCEQGLAYLRHQIKHFDGEYAGANLAYDVDYGYTDGFEWHCDAKFRDVQIADPIINELQKSYSLANIGKRYGIEAKDETLLVDAARNAGLDPKKGLWRLHSKFVGAYGEQDVASPLELLRKQEAIIDRDGLREVYDLETDVLPVLVRMRRRGVRIDFGKMEEIEAWAIQEENRCLDLIKRETGVQIGFDNIMSARAVGPALEAIGVKLQTNDDGSPQIDRFLLGKNDHPVPQAILRIRKVNKLRNTFITSMRKYAIPEPGSNRYARLHCQFHQIAKETEGGDQKGVRYGRLSATDPNLQQQPSPDRDPEVAGEWRKIFVAEEGAIWGCNDYSQQEPRWTTHFASVLDLPRAREAAHVYASDPNADNHTLMTQMIHGERQAMWWKENEPKLFKYHRGNSKLIYLGLCYGEGGAKLAHDLNLPTRWAHQTGWGKRMQIRYFETQREAMASREALEEGFYREVAGEEAQAILDKFNTEVPFVGDLADVASKRAQSRGFVTTICGRRLNFPEAGGGRFDYTHKALNRIIQGSAADQTKRALVEIDRAGHFMQLQVHDETDGSYASVAEAQAVGEIMRNAVTSPWVPFRVDTECGPNWGEIK